MKICDGFDSLHANYFTPPVQIFAAAAEEVGLIRMSDDAASALISRCQTQIAGSAFGFDDKQLELRHFLARYFIARFQLQRQG